MDTFLVDGPPVVNLGVFPSGHAWIEQWRWTCHSGQRSSHPVERPLQGVPHAWLGEGVGDCRNVAVSLQGVL